jgi:hypothetical protein
VAGRQPEAADLERIRQLARDLADSDPGPAGELACALADAVVSIAGRVDALWQLITAVVESAGLSMPEGSAPEGSAPDGSAPPAEFVQALTAARGTGVHGVRLNISGRQWVAAISQDQPPDDPARAWAALKRLAEAADGQDDSQRDSQDDS